MKKIIFLFLTSLAMGFYSCSNKQTTSAEPDEHEHNEGSNTATLSEAQVKSIQLELGSIEKKQLTASLKANGFLQVPNQNKATVSSLAGGVISSILVHTGKTVERGEVIATIANTSFITMQEDYLGTLAKLNLAELEYKRQSELSANNATALKAVQTSEAELKLLKAKKIGLQKQLELLGINTSRLTTDNMQSVLNVVSPIAGAVSNVMVNIGTYADANKAIAEVIDNTRLHADLFVYEKDLAKLKKGQTIHFTLTNNPGKEYDATVYAISNTFEASTKAVSVHADVEGDKTGLIDGMSITALISLENATVDALPTDAIVNYQGQDFIFIVKTSPTETKKETKHSEQEGEHHEHGVTQKAEGELTFERIPVRKGTTDVGYSEITILKEIPADAKIVTKGAFFILAKMTNSGEHEH